MIRLLIGIGVAALATYSARAQSYCAQVRLAVAIYGHEASKQHALAHYGKQAAEAGEKCLQSRTPQSGPQPAAAGQGRRRRE